MLYKYNCSMLCHAQLSQVMGQEHTSGSFYNNNNTNVKKCALVLVKLSKHKYIYESPTLSEHSDKEVLLDGVMAIDFHSFSPVESNVATAFCSLYTIC